MEITTETEKDISQIRKPDFCALIVTNQCMMRCKMCYIWKNKKEPNELSIQDWKDFVLRFKDSIDNKAEINFGGGEALLKEGFLDLVKFCSKQGFSTSMTTCGFLIDENKAQEINDSGLKILNISLDSLDEERHDFLRGVKGVHGRALKAIDYLNKYRHNSLEIGIQTVISNVNLNDILPLVDWVNEDSRLNVIYLQPIVQPYNTDFDYNWRSNSEYVYLWPDDIKRVYYIIDNLIRLKEKGYKITNSLSHLRVFKSYFENPQRFVKKIRCDKGDHIINVNNIGEIYLCYNYESLGNIRNNNIKMKDIWYSAKAHQVRNEMYQCRKNCADLVTCQFEGE